LNPVKKTAVPRLARNLKPQRRRIEAAAERLRFACSLLTFSDRGYANTAIADRYPLPPQPAPNDRIHQLLE